MASDGITKKAIHGTCRICQRVRKTDCKLKAVGEVRHGYATGHIWECIDEKDCDEAAKVKLVSAITNLKKFKIETALKEGRYKEYKYFR